MIEEKYNKWFSMNIEVGLRILMLNKHRFGKEEILQFETTLNEFSTIF